MKVIGLCEPVFRCYKYGTDYPGFVGKDLTAGDTIKSK